MAAYHDDPESLPQSRSRLSGCVRVKLRCGLVLLNYARAAAFGVATVQRGFAVTVTQPGGPAGGLKLLVTAP